MLADSNYENVLFSAGGKGLPNIGFGLEVEFKKAKTYEELIEIAQTSKLNVIDTSIVDYKIQDGKKFGFENLSNIPESAICVELENKMYNLNCNNQNKIYFENKVNFEDLDYQVDRLKRVAFKEKHIPQRKSSLPDLSTPSNLSL